MTSWHSGRESFPSRAGLKILVPGYPQWSWHQRERGLVLFGSFAASLGVAGFAWGTTTGLAVLAFAFGTHVASVADAVRQRAFPGFGAWTPMVTASAVLGIAVYAPALAFLSLVAWPSSRQAMSQDAYLVDYRAFRSAQPGPGDWVWLRASSPGKRPGIARVVATAGQDVEWSGDRLRIDGVVRRDAGPERDHWPSGEMAFTVPDGHVLVESRPGGLNRPGPLLVPIEQVAGRAWARLYPIWKRRLLH